MIHELDQLRWLLDDEIASIEVRSPVADGFQDPQLATIQMRSGVLATVDVFVNASYGYDVRCEAGRHQGRGRPRSAVSPCAPSATGSEHLAVARRLRRPVRRRLPQRADRLGARPRRRAAPAAPPPGTATWPTSRQRPGSSPSRRGDRVEVPRSPDAPALYRRDRFRQGVTHGPIAPRRPRRPDRRRPDRLLARRDHRSSGPRRQAGRRRRPAPRRRRGAGVRARCPWRTTTRGELIDADDVDAVVITASSDAHCELIVASAARPARPVFCEKPMSLTLADADRAIAAAKDAGVQLQVGFNRRFARGLRGGARRDRRRGASARPS